ncbi:chromosome partition protein [Lysobacter capsici AZ78]|uniref:Chromosome partition protein n=2 Tax=Lysobacter capsici TaxID=435897 RepID=A0A108UCW7_9GAMM|nr:chromosome partition protein [Lysobacter capsici AZ78]
MLEVENFRGIKKGCVRFTRNSVFVGANNAGKTTLIEALTLLLGRDKQIRELTEHDFHGSDPQPADRIRLVATITDFKNDDPDDNTDWFREGRAVEKWLNLDTGEIHAQKTDGSWKLCCQVATQAYFDRDSLSVEVARYFHDYDHPFDPFSDDVPFAVPPLLIKQLGFYLVRASRTWDRVFSWGSELFKRTLTAAAAQPALAVLSERNRLRTPELPIELDPQISGLIESVNAELARCMPDAPSIQLRVTNTDSRSVMDAVGAHFIREGGSSVPATRQGSGLVSLQGLLLLLELGRVRAAAGEGFLLALGEPELHLPPASQQQLVQRVQALSTQTITTTHSPLIAAMVEPTSVIILRNDHGNLSAEPFLLEPLSAEAPNWKRKFFQLNRVEVLSALMYTSVLVPEGKADFYLLKTILRALMLTETWAPAQARNLGLDVGVVPTEDAKVVETFTLLSRVHARCCCLVDGDGDGDRYAQGLKAAPLSPVAIIQWARGEMIEDAIGWILQADAGIVASFDAFVPRPATINDVVALLKANKVDIVLYETLADAIASNELCRGRASDLFSGIADACAGHASARFAANGHGIWTFLP